MKVSPHKLVGRCKEASQLLKSMAHPVRLQVLCYLYDQEKPVGELEELCGVSQSQMSQFLSRMRLDGLLSSRKDGSFVYYKVADSNVIKLIQSLQNLYCR